MPNPVAMGKALIARNFTPTKSGGSGHQGGGSSPAAEQPSLLARSPVSERASSEVINTEVWLPPEDQSNLVKIFPRHHATSNNKMTNLLSLCRGEGGRGRGRACDLFDGDLPCRLGHNIMYIILYNIRLHISLWR